MWDISFGDIYPLPCTERPTSDGIGHVACTDGTDLVWEDFSALSTSAPRLLGVLAAASVDFALSAWTPEIDTTKPLTAGSLVIRSSDGTVVKTLATPASPDGSLRRLSWDGRDENGKLVRNGTYTYTVTADAQDGTGTVVSVDGTKAATGTLTVTGYSLFVKASYQDFLGRTPPDAEVVFQATALATGKVSKIDYLASLANSNEWLTTIVTKMYAASRFHSSEEYYNLHAGGTPQSWVTSLYAKLLNRTPDAGGLQFWINHTNDPTGGRDKVAYNFYQSEESRMDRVQAMYHALLNREPDNVGWPFWTQRVLTTGDIALAYDIANSDEYWQRAQVR